MANKEIKVAMKQRSDTAENWKKNNPILLEGEIGYDSTCKAIKIGNGKDNWNTLPYQPGAPGTGVGAEVFNRYIEDDVGPINKATGNWSHAEGYYTEANGQNSHAEGNVTYANGVASHAEGMTTYAEGDASHAEGYSTTALGSYSHAEGEGTTASGMVSHAGGYNSMTVSASSFAHGEYTIAGLKGFSIVGYNETAKTYTLDSVEGLAVNDVFSIYRDCSNAAINGFNAIINVGKITNINNKTVTVDTYQSTASALNDTFYLSILKKPNIGTQYISNAAFAEGHNVNALGGYSHAEGNNTKAVNYNSHAEGEGTTASGIGSHAEGGNTTASNDYSHAEGYYTKASGIISHAEGHGTTASGMGSHAEGTSTAASKDYSHAEGSSTTASGDSSHAEGYGTTASSNYSHAEGWRTIASGIASHAEGWSTKAVNANSHAEGDGTTAFGVGSHAEGYSTKAISSSSSAHGESTIAGSLCFKIKSFDDTNKKYTLDSVEGLAVDDVFCMQLINNFDNYGKITAIDTTNKTVTVDKYHAAETETGKTPSNTFRVPAKPEVGTTDFGDGAFAEGYETVAAGLYSHAEGRGNTAIGKYAHVEGNNNTAVYGAHAEGRNNTASGQMSHVEGSENIGTNYAVHVEGSNNQAHAGNDHVEGENNYVMGGDAHGEGYHNSVLGKYSHAEGSNNKVYGESAHVEGSSNTASGWCSHAGGNSSKSLTNCSFVHGINAVAGVKGFKITATDSSAKTYTLDSVEGLAVNDTFTIFTNNNINYVDYGKITAVDIINKKITVNNYVKVYGILNYIIIRLKPDVGTVSGGDSAFAEGIGSYAFAEASHAEGCNTMAYGVYSHAEGFGTTTFGIASHAEGSDTKAFGAGSHVGGKNSITISSYSFAHGKNTIAGLKCFKIAASDSTKKTYTIGSVEGLAINDVFTLISKDYYMEAYGKITAIDTTNKKITVDNYLDLSGSYKYIAILSKPTIGNTTIGEFAFAEGSGTRALGDGGSHAEGNGAAAIGEYSHAEGTATIAGGMGSHAEGDATTASGWYSHAEGECTTAASNFQHVQGKYNIEDTNNRYAHIVGNGDIDMGAPSNAHTLDWSGNAWFAGDIKIGGTSYDDAAAKTISDLFNKITELTERIEALESQNYVLYDETPPTELNDDNLWKIATIKTGIAGRTGSDNNPATDCVKINVCGTDTKWLGEFDDIDAALYSKDTNTNLYTKVCDFQLTNDVNFDGTNMYCVPYKGATIGPLNTNVISNVYTDHPGALFGYINDSEGNTVFTEYDMNGADNGNTEYYLYTSKKKSEYSSNFSLDGLQMVRIISGDATSKTYTVDMMSNPIESSARNGDFKLLYQYDSNIGKFDFVSNLGQSTLNDDGQSLTYANYVDISNGRYFVYYGHDHDSFFDYTVYDGLERSSALIDIDYENKQLNDDTSGVKARIKLYNVASSDFANISKISSGNVIVKIKTFDPISGDTQTIVENCNVLSYYISNDDKIMLDLTKPNNDKPLFAYLYGLKNFTLINITSNDGKTTAWDYFK